MRRVNVKGSSGAGKSTFAAELARRLDLPYVELDALHHGPNWTEASAEELEAKVRGVIAQSRDGWVIDGNYEQKLGSLVVDAADTIVWLDLPLRVKLGRLWRRTMHRIGGKVELWAGNRESWWGAFGGPQSLFGWALRRHFVHRREWPKQFADDPRLVRLRTPEEAQRWLEEATRD